MMHRVSAVRRVPNSGDQIEIEGEKKMNAFAEAIAAGHYSNVWVCQCCMLVLANGECCDADTHGGDSCEPLSQVKAGEDWTLGLLDEHHDEMCTSEAREYGCDCEFTTFSQSQCDGCGSWLAGERHAATIVFGVR